MDSHSTPYTESDLLPVSRLADIEYCERRAALHLIEMVWEDNVHTAEGTILHERAHSDDTPEKRGDLIVVRGLWIRSFRLGLAGKTDIVELHRVSDDDAAGASIPGHRGRWRVYPVEYKPGRLREQRSFQIQLCAQALCLEEMLSTTIARGAIYYGQPRRRLDVELDEALRATTEQAARRLHELFDSRLTPPAKYEKRCKSCSLLDLCMPQLRKPGRSALRYIAEATAPQQGNSWTG